jgi:hypothetical protein
MSDVSPVTDQPESPGDPSAPTISAEAEPAGLDEIEEFGLDDIEVIESKVFG